MQLAKNQHHITTIEDINSQGMGVAKIDGFPLFVADTITGEKIELRIVHLRKNFGFGKLIEIIEPSPHRVGLTDETGAMSGTLPLQHIDYQHQLEIKHKQVVDAFRRIGGFEDLDIEETIGMDEPWHYRNKAQIPIREVRGRLEGGYFRAGSNDLVPMTDYHIEDKNIAAAINTVVEILRQNNVKAYDPKEHSGEIRHIIIKEGYYTKDLMVVLVTIDENFTNKEKVIEQIKSSVKNLVSITQSINRSKGNRILGRDTEILYKDDYYTDKILDKTFKISTNSFFQVNTRGAEILYSTAINLAGLDESQTVLDAYSGIGTIGITLADRVKEVYGVEVVKDAVQMAKENCEINNVTNAHYITGRSEEALPRLIKDGITFDAVFVDPPRKGLHKDFVKDIATTQPEKIVYISCNPATQARDCKMLAENGYNVKKVIPVDMFPQTSHVECIALLQREII